MKYVITLPYPMSANRYWRPVIIKGHSTIVPTKDAKAFKEQIAWRVKSAGIRKPISGRVRVHIDLYPALPQDHAKRKRINPMNWDDDVRCIDIDNARKVLYDAFKGVVFDDDKWVWSDSASRMEPDGEARVVVTVEQIVRASPQPALFDPHKIESGVIHHDTVGVYRNAEAPF